MKAMKFENQGDAIDAAYRIVGLTSAINQLLDPVSGTPEAVEAQFADRMVAEALACYADALLSAVDLPNPELVFVEPRS